MTKKILLIGGGTGGHIIPLRNLAEELISQKAEVELVVSDSELDREIISKNFAEFTVYYFKTDKIRRYFSLLNFTAPFKITRSIFSARKLIKAIKPDIVFFKGGFVGFPFLMALMSTNFRGKIFGHESDIESGKLTKLLSPIADKIFYSFGEPSYPLFFSTENFPLITKMKKQKTPSKRKLFVFGGSQGAQFINELIAHNLEKITKKFSVFLVTGNKKSIPVKSSRDFTQVENLPVYDLQKKIQESDLVISRAGANSLFEIVSAKKPSLIIPLPSAAKNHQVKNAQYFEKKDLCHIFYQDTSLNFLQEIEKCFKDEKMIKALDKSKIQNSAKKIAQEILT